MKKGWKITLLVLGLLVIDQVVKVVVKTTMTPGETTNVLGRWLQLIFVENDGAAGGLTFGSSHWAKLALSLFRLVAIGGLVWYDAYLLRRKRETTPWGIHVALGLVLAGAIGNMIDSAFYGMIWGYAPFLYGNVVDMFKMPFTFVFNLADLYIVIAVAYTVLFQWKYLVGSDKKGDKKIETK